MQLSSPFEVIEFESERGKGMWVTVRVWCVGCGRVAVESVSGDWDLVGEGEGDGGGGWRGDVFEV